MFLKPNLGAVWSILCVLFAAIVLKIFGIDYITGGLALFFVGIGFGFGVDYFIVRLVYAKMKLYEASQERIKIMDRFLVMDPDQRAAIQAARIVTENFFYYKTRDERWIFPGQPVNRSHYQTADVLAVWNASTNQRFSLIGTWSEGSVRRELCQTMTKFFAGCEWCEVPAGNVGALWIGDGHRKAYEALWETEEDEKGEIEQ